MEGCVVGVYAGGAAARRTVGGILTAVELGAEDVERYIREG